MTFQPSSISKTDLLAHMQRALEDYEQVIGRLSAAQMLDPRLDNGSSFKDLLAHLSAWLRIETYWLEASLRGEQPARYLPGFEVSRGDPEEVINHLNGVIYQAHKNDPLGEVLHGFRSDYRRLYALVESLPEDTLNNPQAFSWWRGEPVWTSIAHNTFLHFQNHLEEINDWLEKTLGALCPV